MTCLLLLKANKSWLSSLWGCFVLCKDTTYKVFYKGDKCNVHRSASLGIQDQTFSIWCSFFLYLCYRMWWWSGSKLCFSKSSPFIQRFGIKAHIGFKESMKFYSKHSGRTEQTGICVKSNSGHMRKDAQGPHLFFGAIFMGFRGRSWGAVECYTGEFLFQLTGLD